jgi:O-antigen ligase
VKSLRWLAALPLLVIFGTFAFIDLELKVGLFGWEANAPAADVATLLLLPLALLGLWVRPASGAPRWPDLPGWPGQLLFLVACALSLSAAAYPDEALHHLIRKPLFVYVAYGFGLGWALQRAASPAFARRALQIGLALTALVSVGSSLGRIAAGDTLWFQALSGITPNHKTLAVALAGAAPLLFGAALRPVGARRPGGEGAPDLLARGLSGLLVLAVLLSASKTAWITLALGLAWFFPGHRPIATRWRALLPGAALALALAYYAPVILGSRTMLDAARSRHSLNERAQHMWEAHPLIGSGTGMNVRWEESTFPHYRVNGVDAHGVFAKVASETGLLGLVGYGLFVGGAGLAMRRRWRTGAATTGQHPYRSEAWAALGAFGALHTNLLFSTELFSPTHWVPLMAAWAAAHREEEGQR